MKVKPRLLILSAVYPFPRNAGQQQRVYYKLQALRENFHLTFLTIAGQRDVEEVKRKLLELCDDAIVLPSAYTRNLIARIVYKVIGTVYVLLTGLKFSNYLTGEVEFSPKRLRQVVGNTPFDGVLFEYWHAFKAAFFFREHNIPTILDMHDILWRSYASQLDAKVFLPNWLKKRYINQYKVGEESAWNAFDILIAINQDEYNYARQHVRHEIKFFYTPMGTDISVWPHCWQPGSPIRVAYYGSLGSHHNQQDALLCYREVMPVIWEQFPDVEFWIVGSNPPAFIRNLEQDKRVHVTGFVDKPQEILKTMSLVLCPWSGTYGFRSRVVEVMALGVPVIASTDAVYGMGFDTGRGIFLGNNSVEMADLGLNLLHDESELNRQGSLARRQMEEKFSYAATYVKFSFELAECLRK